MRVCLDGVAVWVGLAGEPLAEEEALVGEGEGAYYSPEGEADFHRITEIFEVCHAGSIA